MTSRNGRKPTHDPAARVLTVPSTVTGGPTRLLPPTRWAEWVRALAGRWGLGIERNDRLAMILLRPLTLTRHLHERWLVKSERFYPTINLSVQAILRASGPTVFVRGNSREPGLRAGLESGAGVSGHREADRERGSLVPLERIFTRSESPTKKRGAHSSARVEAIIQRLTRQSQRIESNFSPSAMTTRANAYSVTQGKAMSSDGDTAAPWARNREPGFEQSRWQRPELGISIERITDQVIRQLDQRVVAVRERMGRTF